MAVTFSSFDGESGIWDCPHDRGQSDSGKLALRDKKRKHFPQITLDFNGIYRWENEYEQTTFAFPHHLRQRRNVGADHRAHLS
jgi:hypothetical protein